MRFYTVLASRPQYYDRNPTPKTMAFIATSVGPHALTVRASYTVPSNRKTFIGGAQLLMLRDQVEASGATATAYIEYTPSGGTAARLVYIAQIATAVGSQTSQNVGSAWTMLAGDVLTLDTSDGGASGSYVYVMGSTNIEFDA